MKTILEVLTISHACSQDCGVDLLVATGVVDSKSAARRIVKEGGAYLNNQKISGEDFRPSKTDFLCGKYAVLRKGKRDLAAVEIS